MDAGRSPETFEVEQLAEVFIAEFIEDRFIKQLSDEGLINLSWRNPHPLNLPAATAISPLSNVLLITFRGRL